MAEAKAEGAPARAEGHPELVRTIVSAIDTARQLRIEYGVVGSDADGNEAVEYVEDDPAQRLVSIEQAQSINSAELAVKSLHWVHIDHRHD